MKKFKFTVVGGGTAGWLTALFLQKNYKDCDITVIASSEIGILGAGEGTTTHFVDFLKQIDVPISGIIKHAKGTLKNGIKFTNWNGDGEYYYHSFTDTLENLQNVKQKGNFDFVPFYLENISKNKNLDDIQLTSLISDRYQTKFDKETKKFRGTYALHFDASLLAKYLQTLALERGVTLIDDEIIGINNDKDDRIAGFVLKNGGEYFTDYVFDCSGFKRLIIGNHYKTKWISYKDHLPVNRAMPFFVKNEGKQIPPYTEAIAMKYGWIWRIPVQGRYGCGYVFDSSFVTDEEIKKEIEEYFGHEIVSPRIFTFEPGVYDKVCIKNCVSIGLSSGFVEPLEATSIWVSIMLLKEWGKRSQDVINCNESSIDYLNRLAKDINRNILNFLQYHYITKRNDSEFWRTFLTKNKKLPMLEDLDAMNSNTVPKEYDFKYLSMLDSKRIGGNSDFNGVFSENSWHQVGSGIRYFKQEVAKSILKTEYSDFDSSDFDMKTAFEINSKQLFDHHEYLEHLINEYS
jgi:tryptophan halogenase